MDNATQNVNMQRKGTFAARPTAATAKSGCYYYATDIGVQFLSDGTNWITMNDNTDPIGTIKGFIADADPSDSRWVRCDGRAISRSTYAALFTLASTTYGVGDGSTTFNIPDLRGRTLVAVDGAAARLTANDALGNSGGEETHLLTLPESPAHAHGTGDATYTRFPNFKAVGGSGSPIYIPGTSTASGYEYALRATTDSQGGGGAHNNMQPYLVAQYIVRIA